VAQTLAARHHCAVAVTGVVDYVADSEQVFMVRNGHPLMAQVTGTGCTASAICAAFVAVCGDHAQAAAEALAVFGLAGERAAVGGPGPGTFHARLYDELDALTPEAAASGVRIERA
jgi:hydroxyethylthiazole kinase